MNHRACLFAVALYGLATVADAVDSGSSNSVRVKELARVDGARENPLAGYGIVVGLAGTGDSSRSDATLQSVANALTRFGLQVTPDQLASRNAAAVFVTSRLPAFANIGDRIDINVASVGDARSLLGGTLLMTPLQGPNDKVYALAQGPVSVGGYRYDAMGNLVQKNHPTVGMITGGASIENTVANELVSANGSLHLLLNAPDFTTASRIASALAQEFGPGRLGAEITAQGPDRVVFRMTEVERARYVEVVKRIENVMVVPDSAARVVVNERTGTVVSGGDVRIGQITVTHGELKVTIDTDFTASQPVFVARAGEGVRTVVLPDTEIKVKEPEPKSVSLAAGTTVANLVLALNKIKATPRDVITILQGIQRAGALHAELVVQ